MILDSNRVVRSPWKNCANEKEEHLQLQENEKIRNTNGIIVISNDFKGINFREFAN